jgi:hypothetical protein
LSIIQSKNFLYSNTTESPVFIHLIGAAERWNHTDMTLAMGIEIKRYTLQMNRRQLPNYCEDPSRTAMDGIGVHRMTFSYPDETTPNLVGTIIQSNNFIGFQNSSYMMGSGSYGTIMACVNGGAPVNVSICQWRRYEWYSHYPEYTDRGTGICPNANAIAVIGKPATGPVSSSATVASQSQGGSQQGTNEEDLSSAPIHRYFAVMFTLLLFMF